jgi:CRP-like cAMP-binding protein
MKLVLIDRLWVLISGSAQVGKRTLLPGRWRSLSKGESKLARRLATIGEMAILTNSTYRETAIATGSKNLTLAIAADSFNELIANDPIVARKLLPLVSRTDQFVKL